eukprot:8945035-Lingulodinium_polyedra.AAC.1
MHVHCRAEKQNPFLAWRRGEQVCKAQLRFPGQGAATVQAEAFARRLWALGHDTCTALDRVVTA